VPSASRRARASPRSTRTAGRWTPASSGADAIHHHRPHPPQAGSASIARTAAGAQAAAAASAATSLASSGRVCRRLQVATSTADFRAGGTVTVTVTCAIRL
jgi:hypothetical protein